MRIRSVKANNRRHAFEVMTERGTYPLPYSFLEPAPSAADPLVAVSVDPELGFEGFTWVLRSGQEGSAHIDTVLEYNRDPSYMRDLLLYRLTLEARKCVEDSPLSTREIIRRLRTSPAQFYRLLDPANRGKSVDKLLVLLAALDCDVDFTVRPSRTAPRAGQKRTAPTAATA